MGRLGLVRRSGAGVALEAVGWRTWSRLSAREAKTRVPRLFVFGHQKTGTSVVAATVGAMAAQAVTIDLPLERVDPSLGRGLGAAEILARNRPYSSRPILKEPNLTPAAVDLLAACPRSVAVGVRREACEVIESICFRLGLAAVELDGEPPVERWWRPIVAGDGLSIHGGSTLERLAARIAHFEAYIELAAMAEPDRMVVIDYRAFMQSPLEVAGSLADLAGWEVSGHPDLERQYQPGLRAATPAERERYRLSAHQRERVQRVMAGDPTQPRRHGAGRFPRP